MPFLKNEAVGRRNIHAWFRNYDSVSVADMVTASGRYRWEAGEIYVDVPGCSR